jgi:preprotein translocase subunit SecB
MKPSPLQLNYVAYPKILVQAIPLSDEDSENEIDVSIELDVGVRYEDSGDHTAILNLKNSKEVGVAFDFEVQVFAKFSIDNELALAAYKERFPVLAAVDVARILFSGARELLATVSARSPHGALSIPSMILQPSDVNITFESAPEKLVPALFGVPFESLKLFKRDPSSVALNGDEEE